MKFSEFLPVCLCLFDGGAGAAASGAGAGAEGDGSQGGSQAAPASTRRGTSGEYENVRFGKQDAPAQAGAPAGPDGQQQPPDAGGEKEAGVQTTSDTMEERKRAFQELINGEYKDLYTQETRSLEQLRDKTQPVIDMLMQRYKIADGDLGKLTKAVENDDAYWSQAAEEAGMEVEQYKQFQRLQRENAQLRRAQRQRQGQQAAQQQLQRWFTEGEQVRALYPGFDLGKESKNPQFLSMLRAGVPVQTAYEVIHMDDIKAGVAQTTARRTEKQVVDGIRAKGSRPPENGTSSQSAFTVKDDPSKWTKQDRAEIARRVARGETIKL